jgi:rod shape-determining protein MreC
MQNFFSILSKYHVTLVFVVLQIFSIILIFQGKNHHRNTFINSANALTGNTYQTIQNVSSYTNLREVNEKLAYENAVLRKLIPSSLQRLNEDFVVVNDTVYRQQYTYRPGRVVNNTIYKKNNFLTVNLGEQDGILPEMGVITSKGVVGFVGAVSDNFCTVVSFLNSKANVSVKIKTNGAAGTLYWDAESPNVAVMSDVPLTTQIEKGDTIVSSGYSSIYPAGIPVGVVANYDVAAEKQMRLIKVELFENFNTLDYVYVVENLLKTEINELQEEQKKLMD